MCSFRSVPQRQEPQSSTWVSALRCLQPLTCNRLTSEEMMPYVNRVLSQPRSWAVQVMGLLTKSRLEMERTRTIKRAVTQLEVCTAEASQRILTRCRSL